MIIDHVIAESMNFIFEIKEKSSKPVNIFIDVFRASFHENSYRTYPRRGTANTFAVNIQDHVRTNNIKNRTSYVTQVSFA